MIPEQYRSLDTLRETRWLTEQGVQEVQVDPLMRSWLLEKGLLTERLRSLCGAHFRLEVLNGLAADRNSLAPSDSPTTANGFKREVVMWCHDEPCIYAKTSVSQSTAKNYAWLRTLGTEPLGQRLQSLTHVTRSGFEFTCVQTDGSNLESVGRFPVTDELWARRSSFTIQSHQLTVFEVFLPGLIACEDRYAGRR